VKLGNPIFGNILMVGALAGTGVLPIDRRDFEAVISEGMPAEKVDLNLNAFDLGMESVQQAR
jgi:indolepyruvate ferredoxin oxidoreductase beta subunit